LIFAVDESDLMDHRIDRLEFDAEWDFQNAQRISDVFSHRLVFDEFAVLKYISDTTSIELKFMSSESGDVSVFVKDTGAWRSQYSRAELGKCGFA
jgi:predicted DNA binding CopG/RHH family protein